MRGRTEASRCTTTRLSLWLGCGLWACAQNSAPDGHAGDTPNDSGSLGADDAAAEDAGPDLADTGPPCVEPADGGLPEDVFCTGLYDGRNAQQISSEVMPYKPGVTLWSDGAEKRRFLALPAGSTIDTSDMDAWQFPVGTKAWKEFRVGGALVETRLFWKRSATAWASGTYIWNADASEAALNTSRKPIVLDSGYEIPTTRDCGKCHHGAADQLLGVEAVALGLPNAEGATLTALVSQSALSHPPATTNLTLPEDNTGKAGEALGYLHANCGMPCHSTRGLGDETQLVLRLRADELLGSDSAGPVAAGGTDAYHASLRVMPTTAAVAQAFPGAVRIAPGDHTMSLLWLLSHRRDKYQMPPLVSHAIDEVGTAQLASWIDAL